MTVIDGIRRYLAYKKQRQEVEFLLSAARIQGCTVFTTLLDRFPQLRLIAEPDCLAEWDLLMFVANVGTAAFTSQCFRSREQTKCILLALEHAMLRSGSLQYRLYCDFYASAHHAPDGVEPAMAIGRWFYDALDKITSGKARLECPGLNDELVRATGGIVLVGFSNWWNPGNE